MGLLDRPLPFRTRRNHGIEHATVHILTGQQPGTGLAGRSDGGGFWLYGQVETDKLREAVEEAIRRLPDEPSLAIHPNCGTNLVVGGVTAGLASLAAVATVSDRDAGTAGWRLWPRFLLAGTAAALAGASLGPWVQQRYTTLPDSRGVTVRSIRRRERGRHVMHRIELADETM
jgi:hypothetical protein